MSLRVHNTLTRRLEPFTPLEPGHVRMYVCGITVYDLCHAGHARFLIAFDVVFRWLRELGYRVTYVRNITDVDDKIIRRALERNMPIRQLTQEMIAELHKDVAAMHIEPPTHEPLATEHIAGMLTLIGQLEAKGLAYRAEGGDVNYAVRKMPGYGKLSGKSLDQLRAGERVAVLEGKEDPLDFVLWKAAKPTEPDDAKWPSDYGPGRPGWHIECSAMCMDLLGERFDIHGGGVDLVFPHHENEIAQSEGAHDGKFATYWLHNGHLTLDGVKMSKSLGNFFTIRDVLKTFDGETLRYYMLRVHYRSPFNYTLDGLEDARSALRRLYTALDAAGDVPAAPVDWNEPRAAAFRAAMNDDFNTPVAVAQLFELAGDANRGNAAAAALLKGLGATLGILQQSPRAFLQGGGAALDAAAIEERIAARAQAKQQRDFALADQIRAELLAQGVVLKDSASGTTWVKA